jgi:outer membrane receptor protein involved in Fe transport
MARDNGGVYVPITDPESYYEPGEELARQPTGSGAGFAYAVGNQYFRENINANAPALKPEVADTWTLGAVISSPATSGLFSRLNLTVDYFNISIEDPISAIGAGGILLQCISPQYNPAAEGVAAGASSPADLNSPEVRARAQAAIAASTCPDVFRSASAGFGANGGLDSARVFGTYGNEGAIKLSGIDATLNWSADAGPGTVFVGLNGNYMIDFKLQELEGQPFVDYVGTTGTNALGVNSGSSFEYRIFGNLGYSWGPATLALQWQHIPATEDGGEARFLSGLAEEGTDATGLPAYNLFNLNGSYELNQNVRLRFGVDNLFNKRPPLTNIDADFDPSLGQLPGGGYSFFHDVLGRRFSLGANMKF